ncbi:MAG: twin-arginine translocase TatA/TatE family subunit [Candidatus Nitrosotenuis sp.]|jgi:sec-independent protein translocase protein TatA
MLQNFAGLIAGQEWIFIAIAAGIILFGAKKIPELAKTLGRSRVEYEKGKVEAEKELKDLKEKKD